LLIAAQHAGLSDRLIVPLDGETVDLVAHQEVLRYQ